MTLDRASILRIKSLCPEVGVAKGAIVLTIRAEGPSEVVLKTREFLEKVKAATSPAKGFK
jgi:hypothetical protein